MYRLILIFIFIGMFYSIKLHSVTNCECGTHADGRYFYSVPGVHCCTSAAYQNGAWKQTYISNEGVWEHDKYTEMGGATVQGICCQN